MRYEGRRDETQTSSAPTNPENEKKKTYKKMTLNHLIVVHIILTMNERKLVQRNEVTSYEMESKSFRKKLAFELLSVHFSSDLEETF